MVIKALKAILGITRLEDELMAFKDEVNAKVQEIKDEVAKKAAEFDAELAEFKARLDEALSSAVSAEDKAAILADLDSVKASFAGKFDVDPSKPVPEPPVEPEPPAIGTVE